MFTTPTDVFLNNIPADMIEKEMRKLFSIPDEKETRLWNRYMSNTFEPLNKPDSTIQDAGLYQGQVGPLVILSVPHSCLSKCLRNKYRTTHPWLHSMAVFTIITQHYSQQNLKRLDPSFGLISKQVKLVFWCSSTYSSTASI